MIYVAIASFAGKVFSASSKKVYTFDGLSRSGELQTEDIEVEGKKPSTHIKGPSLEQLTFTVSLSTAAGVNVEKEIDDWVRIKDAGVPYVFTLGSKPVSSNKFLLKSVSIDHKRINNKGAILAASLSLSFQEYARAGKATATATKAKASGKASASESKQIVDSLVDNREKFSKMRDNPAIKAAIAQGAKIPGINA